MSMNCSENNIFRLLVISKFPVTCRTYQVCKKMLVLLNSLYVSQTSSKQNVKVIRSCFTVYFTLKQDLPLQLKASIPLLFLRNLKLINTCQMCMRFFNNFTISNIFTCHSNVNGRKTGNSRLCLTF